MYKKTILALIVVLFGAGCTVQGLVPALNCEERKPAKTCQGNPDDPKVNINRNSLNFSPRNVCARAGTKIEFTLTPNSENEVGNAAIVPKAPKDTWLVGTNAPNEDKIFIDVPEWVSDGDHDYGLLLSDGSCVDPRIEVTH